jgi:hypothetical protein
MIALYGRFGRLQGVPTRGQWMLTTPIWADLTFAHVSSRVSRTLLPECPYYQRWKKHQKRSAANSAA